MYICDICQQHVPSFAINKIGELVICDICKTQLKKMVYPPTKQPNRLQIAIQAIIYRLYKILTGVHPGTSIYDWKHIRVGKNVRIGPNVVIRTRNHNVYCPDLPEEHKNITIEDYCWIGANAVILPGVHLGRHTVVGAGAVVTKSFPEGYCVVAGVPAKIVKILDKKTCDELTRLVEEDR